MAFRNELLVFDRSEYKARLANVRESMRKEDMDVAIIHSPEDNCYLTGHPHGPPQREAITVIPLDGELVMLERAIEGGNVELILGKTIDRALYWYDTTKAPPYFVAHHSPALLKMIKGVLDEQGLANKRIGVQMGSRVVTAAVLELLKKGLPDATFVDATLLVENYRLIKSPAEIAYIRTAAKISSKGLAAGINAVKEGVSENDLVLAILRAMLECPECQPPIHGAGYHVASGPRAAMAHTTWGGRLLRNGDTIYQEIPASVNRYHAITTRTTSVGGPASEKMQKCMKAVIEGQQAAIDAMKPGVTAGEVDKACRSIIEKAGFGEYFRHRTGYTIGLDWVQEHGINLVPGSTAVLKTGMTFHVIPNCFFFGEGCAAFSDSVLVTEDGPEVLTTLPRELFIRP